MRGNCWGQLRPVGVAGDPRVPCGPAGEGLEEVVGDRGDAGRQGGGRRHCGGPGRGGLCQGWMGGEGEGKTPHPPHPHIKETL